MSLFIVIGFVFISGLIMLSIDGMHDVAVIVLISSSGCFGLWVFLVCVIFGSVNDVVESNNQVHPESKV